MAQRESSLHSALARSVFTSIGPEYHDVAALLDPGTRNRDDVLARAQLAVYTIASMMERGSFPQPEGRAVEAELESILQLLESLPRR